jgi:hypothetical protein
MGWLANAGADVNTRHAIKKCFNSSSKLFYAIGFEWDEVLTRFSGEIVA